MSQFPPNPLGGGPPRLIGGVFGFAFAGIGLTLLGFLWGTPFDQWDSPPLFFRIFGSFIAIVFVAVGGSAFIAALRGQNILSPTLGNLPLPPIRNAPSSANAGPVGYQCPHCGAPLPDKADVSPMGDTKCPFCHTWFNIHQPG